MKNFHEKWRIVIFLFFIILEIQGLINRTICFSLFMRREGVCVTVYLRGLIALSFDKKRSI